MQLVLLAAGRGIRLGLDISNKCFTKICGKCLLDYNLEMFSCFDVSEIILIIGHNAKTSKSMWEQIIMEYLLLM